MGLQQQKDVAEEKPLTKNEHYRGMLGACGNNRLKFRYVLNDVWYSSSENMVHVKRNLEKEFIMPLKTNRKVALSLETRGGESTSESRSWNWNRTRG